MPVLNEKQLAVLSENIRLAGPERAMLMQSVMAIEEMSELTKEITKILRGKGDIAHMTEEAADVYIVLESLKMICGLGESAIAAVVDAKIRRLAELKGIAYESAAESIADE